MFNLCVEELSTEFSFHSIVSRKQRMRILCFVNYVKRSMPVFVQREIKKQFVLECVFCAGAPRSSDDGNEWGWKLNLIAVA